MADIAVAAADVRPLPGATTMRFLAGGTVSVGDLVYIDSAGKVLQGAGASAPAAHSFGVVVAAPNGKLSAVLNETVDVTVWGPVTGFSAMTPGDILYQSNTAGKFGDAAGTVSHKIAKPLTAVTLFIRSESEEA